MNTDIYPLTFEPIYKDYIWGGDRIAKVFGRDSTPEICAESWEITDRPEGMSVILGGPLAGKTLHDAVAAMGARLVGTAAPPGPFPLLFKILDARERTSLQVHPSEVNVGLVGGEPKTEMWYVLKGTRDGRVFVGLRDGVDRTTCEKALRSGSLGEIVNSVPVSPGDAIFIPGGRIHAIGEGCLVYEVQLNSDTTYRVSDWGRVGPDGQPRALEFNKAFTVIDWHDSGTGLMPPREVAEMGLNSRWEICSSPRFRVEKLELGERLGCQNDARSFHVLFVEAGSVMAEGGGIAVPLRPGTSCLLPAALREYTLTPVSGAPADRAFSEPASTGPDPATGPSTTRAVQIIKTTL